MTDEEKARASRIIADIERQVVRDGDRFNPWACLQRMVGGKLPVTVALQLLRRLRDAGEQEPINHPGRWAWMQTAITREHAELHLTLSLEAHERRKRATPNMQCLGDVMRTIGAGPSSTADEPAFS
jgi:hypothetical protein